MNYLFRYLSSLKPFEVERLGELDISPRERDLLELLLRSRRDTAITKQAVMEELAMSGSMFDKTCSMLLREALEYLAGPEGMGQLKHLMEHAVADLALHEVRRQEKECVARGNRRELARFYADAFNAIHLRFSSDYPERFARQMAAKYRRTNPSPDTEIHIEACLAGMAVWLEASRRTGGDAARARLEKRLRNNDARIGERTGVIPRYRQLKSWIVFYGQLRRNPEGRIACLRAAAELCEHHPDILPLEEKVLTLCQIAEEHYYYRTDLRTPFEMYRDLYERYPDLLCREEYHTFKFIQLAIINGEHAVAAGLLEKHFGADANMVVHGGGRSKDVALLWTKLMLFERRLEEARAHLDDAILLNQKGFYLQFEVECRMLHTAICYLDGDFDTVERRIPAHIKFLRSKGITYTTSRYYPWFFKLVGSFIDERTTGKKLAPKLEKKLEDYMEGPAAQYGMLLRKMRGA